MKLSVSCLFALVQSAPEKRLSREPRDQSSSRLVPCKQDSEGRFSWTLDYWGNGYGRWGHFVFNDYEDNQYCYVEFGKACDFGVEVQFTSVQLENGSNGCNSDWILFEYEDVSHRTQLTNRVCGCYGHRLYGSTIKGYGPCDVEDIKKLEHNRLTPNLSIVDIFPMAQLAVFRFLTIPDNYP